jgi:AraC family transcriptional regulator
MVERLAVESGAVPEGRPVCLVDPMCSPDPDIEAICRQMVREMARPDRCARLTVDALVHALTIRLLRGHSNISGSTGLGAKSARDYRDWRLKHAVDYLEAHLAEDVGLPDVAEAAGLSVTHLTTLFRDGTGETPYRYLMRRRFERACELLGDPSISVGDIAYRCGFANSQHLAAVARSRLGMTPTAYRGELLS